MVHFIGNLENYLMVKVIECTWRKFQDGLIKVTNLDAITKLHENFLIEILNKSLLTQKHEAIFKFLKNNNNNFL